MKENDVTYFGGLLGLEAKDVEALIENGGFGEKITALNMMLPDQVAEAHDALEDAPNPEEAPVDAEQLEMELK